MGAEYGQEAAWYIYSAILIAAMAATYVMFLRSYRRMSPRAARVPEIRYYFISVRSREAEGLLAHAMRMVEDGDYVRAVREARDAVSRLLSEACRRLGAGCEGEEPEAEARALQARGYYLWPQGVRELEALARGGYRKRKDAERALEIALRVMSLAREIRIEPPREAGAGKEGNQVPGSS
ncbi:MAG: hypothetical protein ACP5NG_00360 [Conexivisphaera sp.]